MALQGYEKAYTTARVGAMRVGSARVAYAPRCTDDVTPQGVPTHGTRRFPCHKRFELPDDTHTEVLR